jgi:hypothetical protein
MSIGFIILRHVNNEKTGKYWERCYDSIRKYHPEKPIMIIDDNSNYGFISGDKEKSLVNTRIIRSEYPKRGELLPYIYYLRNRFCEKVVIIHDSVFLNSSIDLNCGNYKLIWSFVPTIKHNKVYEYFLLKLYRRLDLLNIYARELFMGCFGGMIIISWDFLNRVNKLFPLDRLIPYITCREHRCCFERVIAIILQSMGYGECLLGDIHKYCKWGGGNPEEYKHLPIIKIWTGR